MKFKTLNVMLIVLFTQLYTCLQIVWSQPSFLLNRESIS